MTMSESSDERILGDCPHDFCDGGIILADIKGSATDPTAEYNCTECGTSVERCTECQNWTHDPRTKRIWNDAIHPSDELTVRYYCEGCAEDVDLSDERAF